MPISFDTPEGRRQLAAGIDALPPRERERRKPEVLLSDVDYRRWLMACTRADELTLRAVAADWIADLDFHDAFASDLGLLDRDLAGVAGDLRLHSFSVYAVTRCLRPFLVAETGVASGKSSSAILLALEHNSHGAMVSFDLPNHDSALLTDGAKTSTRTRDVGWLVPAYLRPRWTLHLGDSLTEMARYATELAPCDLFFHDSLHTLEHVRAELALISATSFRLRTVMVDDLDTGAGDAFNEFAASRQVAGNAFRNFGIANL